MATLAAPVEAKYVTALLNGLARRRFHDDTMYTPQYLHDHLFSDSPMAAEGNAVGHDCAVALTGQKTLRLS